MSLAFSHVIGIDSSLKAPALVALAFDDLRRKPLGQCVRTLALVTDEKHDLADRLALVYNSVIEWAALLRSDPDFVGAVVAIEGFSFADRFRKYDIGAAAGVIRMAVRRSLGVHVKTVTPREAKAFICPDWHGFSNANWDAAFGPPAPGKKRKKSMPDKVAVAAALFERYKFDPRDEHVVDATLVALTHARNLGVLPDAHAPQALTPRRRSSPRTKDRHSLAKADHPEIFQGKARRR